MLEEFKKFAMKGNVVDLAIGVIIGAAFGKIVESLVGDVIMPAFGANGAHLLAARSHMRDLAQVLAHVHDEKIEMGEGPESTPQPTKVLAAGMPRSGLRCGGRWLECRPK